MIENIKKTTIHDATYKKYIKWMWRLFFGGIAFMFLLFFLASIGVFGKLPTFEELENPQSDLASQVISEDGVTIGKYFKENRTPIKYKELPKNLINATVATEDARFYKHSGIDFRGTLRAFAFLGTKGGASTVTQQLAKLLFHKKRGNLIFRLKQKLKEWVIAVKLERQYTKEEIMAMYFNKMGFIYNAVGIRSASRIYFGKEPKDLKQEESAVIVAMLKNPRQYNPRREISKKKAFLRRNQVIKNLNKYGFITLKVKDSLQKLPTVLDFSPEDTNDGMATYFREYLRKYMQQWVKDNPKENGDLYDIHRDGLKIHVSIDSRMQKYAEEAMEEHMASLQKEFDKYQKKRSKYEQKWVPFNGHKEKGITLKEAKAIMKRAMKSTNRWYQLKKAGKTEKEIIATFHKKTDMTVFAWNHKNNEKDTIMTPYDSIKYYKQILRSGLMSVEPQNGHVKAWVGGINHKYFKYDAVKQGKRQVGSTFKPMVYATVINQLKYSPCRKIKNTPFTMPKGRYGIPEDWVVHNAGEKYTKEAVSMKVALAKSINVISARLIDEVSPLNVVKLARKMGIKSKELVANPSIALGSVDLSIYEMIGALSTFVNKGMYIKPIMILRIEDKNGTVLESFTPKSNEVMSAESAYAILNLMEGVTQSGSGIHLRTSWKKPSYVTGHPYNFKNPIAGKTGTTQNQSDGWFMGMVPNLATGVWVGGDDRSVHFPDIARGQGATMALPIWALFYKKMYADKDLKVSDKDFPKPSNMTIELNCDDEKTDETAIIGTDGKPVDVKTPEPDDEDDDNLFDE
ncbi:MAG: transglycosylase domain-containing protein [Flavobacteriaceae bacterium]